MLPLYFLKVCLLKIVWDDMTNKQVAPVEACWEQDF